MKIYTSYFAKIRKLPDTIVPISICIKAPNEYFGLQYKKLAPTWDILSKWKFDHNNVDYTKRYNIEVLGKLDCNTCYAELEKLSHGKDIALVCYERATDFCHRHIAADWFAANGYECNEINL